MYEYQMHAPNQLSGGQKQRIAIAGIIAMRPSCIVLDEPTAMLDPKGRMEVMKTVRLLNRNYGITVILITHYMEEAAQADRVIVMDDGNILLDDTPAEVFSHVEEMKTVGLDVPQVTELVYELQKPVCLWMVILSAKMRVWMQFSSAWREMRWAVGNDTDQRTDIPLWYRHSF